MKLEFVYSQPSLGHMLEDKITDIGEILSRELCLINPTYSDVTLRSIEHRAIRRSFDYLDDGKWT